MQKKYPILTTRGIIVFPSQDKVIEVGRKQSLGAINVARLDSSFKLVIVSQKRPDQEIVNNDQELYTIGTLVTFTIDKQNTVPGQERIVAHGISRVKIDKLFFTENLIAAEITELVDILDSSEQEQAYKRSILNLIQSGIAISQLFPQNVLKEFSSNLNGAQISDVIGNYLPISLIKKQKLLSELHVNKRLKLITDYLAEENEISKIEKNLDQSVRKNLDLQQREFLLRERLKAIKEELGEISTRDKETDQMMRIAQSGILPEYVETKILEEIKKYENIPSMSAESNVYKSYIDWVLKIPWKILSKDSTSLKRAIRILNEDHYGLEKIKERIIEFLAVKLNTKSSSAPIICFVGPPGVGKTSLAKSIARAMERKFVKVSLGGLRDEAEIRGHRRTYVGAMPGKIIKSIVKANVANPLILLDELDKMSSDFKGDPTSAMLEVLDPEQNKTFQDHYLEFDFDLSKVIFVGTANYFQNIPEPLIDRVEVIELHSYTVKEKIQIAKQHLIKKTLQNNGLLKQEFKISTKSLTYLINRYTMESGVRGLIRVLDKIARKLVVLKLENKLPKINLIDENQIQKLLGNSLFDPDEKDKTPQVGAVTGLAYTQYGGATMVIEATLTPGKGHLKLTGQLKDVMSESAQIAVTYVKANADKFDIKLDFSEYDIHIHAAAGAIPKDGPSAGVTFTTAIISVLTQKRVSPNVAMTGEITLRGHVLPIGGLKEKSLAALRLGIKTVFIPKQNVKDLKEFDPEILRKIKFIPVEKYEQIYEQLF